MNTARGYPALKSFFFFSPESPRGLNSEDEFIILVMALIRVQTHNGGPTLPFGTYIPASGTRRKEKNWNNQHINERRVIGGGSAVANVKTDKGPRTKVMHRWIMGVCHEFGRLIKNQCMPLLFWRLIYHASHVCWFFSSFFYPWRRVEKFFEISINNSNLRHVACNGKRLKQ